MVEILNQQKRHKIELQRFEALLDKLMAHYKLNTPEMTLAFVNNKTIQDLNRRFMQKDAPTDVLSFPIRDMGADGKYYLGDIIISVPYANRQRQAQGHSLERELEILTIHGFLHLQDFEHFKGLEKEEQKVRKLLLED
ncbi:MAG: rRNA maturation RNase YbeY [Candidatus Aminicenantes bacterium]|nr:rRNA maturation RNase YbeY [Candidatus Aminicenantes bacterium]